MQGKVHIYCGDGKGKTTCSAGLALRAAGSGFKVIFVQFLKSGHSGEIEMLKKIGVTVIRSAAPVKFTFQMNEQELAKTLVINNNLLEQAKAALTNEKTLLVLDEAVGALDKGLLDEERVIKLLEKRGDTEIVLTGRNPSERLVSMADYVSEIKKIKHPYDLGTDARKGIEF